MVFQQKKPQPRIAFVTWWTFMLFNNNDLWYCNKETLVWDFLLREKKITYLGIMLYIKANTLEGEYSKWANGIVYP